MKVVTGLFFLLACWGFAIAQQAAAGVDARRVKPVQVVYLMGESGTMLESSAVWEQLLGQARQDGADAHLVLLGNVLSQSGWPDSSRQDYARSMASIEQFRAQLDLFPGETILLPGNHEWANGRDNGLEHLMAFGNHFQTSDQEHTMVLPPAACPGPYEVALSEQLVMLVLDSQWWLQQNEKANQYIECLADDNEDEEDIRQAILVQLVDALRRNRDKVVVVAAHHPIVSKGMHGGHFPAAYSLFPLRDIAPELWLPLPGFLYTAYRKYLGFPQDLAALNYKFYRQAMETILANFPGVIYVSAHESNMQYQPVDDWFHVVVGSPDQSKYVGRSHDGGFVSSRKGYTKILMYADGSVFLEFWSVGDDGAGEKVFEQELLDFQMPYFQVEPPLRIPKDSTVAIAASKKYERPVWWQRLMGSNYREEWATEVNVPVFDIAREQGGLQIVKRGGGQQTRSIRLEADNGRQYVLRSVEKHVEGALPRELQKTFAVDIVQDGISQSHPYAALAVPKMADAAGVFHTRPKVVFLPDDPGLGIYRPELANQLFLYEERPANNWAGSGLFGDAEKIISTPSLINKIHGKPHHQIDQQAVLKARLFDTFLSDWDRHDDQWRWAAFSQENKVLYRPVPRDRDQVFFTAQGPVMWIAKRKWAVPKFQGFAPNTPNVPGFIYNARYFDRSFLNEPDWSQWEKAVVELQQSLTDTVIEAAVKDLPDPAYQLSGKKIAAVLKVRRDRLMEFARMHYGFISRAVDVVGTQKNDLFEVQRLPDGKTRVTNSYVGIDQDTVLRYQRLFLPDETREIRLYGLSGKDLFVLQGKARKGIKIRVIGGKGKDRVIDHSAVQGEGKKTLVYDSRKTAIEAGRELRLKGRLNKKNKRYNRKLYKYSVLAPVASFGYNKDDGLFLGGGAFWKYYNFQDSIWQKVVANYSFLTGNYNLGYQGWFSGLVPGALVEIEIQNHDPGIRNFFGLGNQCVKGRREESYHWMRFDLVRAGLQIRKSYFHDRLSVYAGGFYRAMEVIPTANRFVNDFEVNGLSPDVFLDRRHAGLKAGFLLDTRDDIINPTKGVFLGADLKAYFALNDPAKTTQKVRASTGGFLSFNKEPRLVFGFRGGVAKTYGEFDFFDAQSMGGKDYLRGFRADRFAGRSLVYANTELRYKLFDFSTYIFSGDMGLMAFFDVGRVWHDQETSRSWHNGYGSGVWVSPFRKAIIRLGHQVSVEENHITVSFNFLF